MTRARGTALRVSPVPDAGLLSIFPYYRELATPAQTDATAAGPGVFVYQSRVATGTPGETRQLRARRTGEFCPLPFQILPNLFIPRHYRALSFWLLNECCSYPP